MKAFLDVIVTVLVVMVGLLVALPLALLCAPRGWRRW